MPSTLSGSHASYWPQSRYFGSFIVVRMSSSDWPARAAAAVGFLVPPAIRGSQRERELRDYIIDLVERATNEGAGAYEHFQTAMVRLHREALEQRLRGMALSEIRLFAEPGQTETSVDTSDEEAEP